MIEIALFYSEYQSFWSTVTYAEAGFHNFLIESSLIR